MKSKVSNKNKFMRILALPWKALTKARDCYVNNMMNYTVVNPRTLPKSYSRRVSSSSSSINNDSEDFRELVRAASTRSMRDINFDLNFVMQQRMRQQMPSRKLVSRSCSVGMARIDEDKPCVLGEDHVDVIVKNDLKYPRSRSYGIMKKNNGVV